MTEEQKTSEVGIDAVLRRAFHLGQTYWHQCDSEYTSDHRRANETREKFNELLADTVARLPAPATGDELESFQRRVLPWMIQCFGPAITADRIERNHRFFEEATECAQANGMTRSEAHQLVDYTFDRPMGELRQEVGGVMVTLAALCIASDVDMHEAGDVELARVWKKIEQIRAKQAAKPKHSPLPEHVAAPQWPAMREQLHAFLNAAAGEGHVMDGVDAADLYIALFPAEYAAATGSIDAGTPYPAHGEPGAFEQGDAL